MKRLLILLLIPCAQAAVRADVAPAVTQCGVTVDAQPKVVINAVTVPVSPSSPTGRVCDYNTDALSQGNHTIRMTAIIASTPTVIGGESATSMPPFDFAKLDAPSTPSNLRIQ